MKQREQKAYAKINLALDVTGRREDGYHLVDMIMNQVDLWDTVRVETEESIGEFMRKEKIFLSISGADLAADSTNLAWKAAECIGEIWKQKNNTEIPAVRIFIKKRIPMAAGLAGGSADCAAVLLGLNALWNLQLSLEELMEIGLRLGADVPFCLMGQAAADSTLGVSGGGVCARAEGIGEKLTVLKAPSLWVLLVKPDLSLSTGEIYRKLDLMPSYSHPCMDVVVQALEQGNLQKVFENSANVLENSAAFEYPIIKYTKNKIKTKTGASYTAMSGSGPTVFGLYFTPEQCRKGAELMEEEFSAVYAVALHRSRELE